MAKNDIPKSVKCSFCGKTQDNVRKIIAGPGVYICNECVGLCNEIIDAEYSDEDTYTLAELDEIPSPKEIKEILDCSPSTARAVMTKLRDMKVVKAENGKGKGKYVFIE